MILIASFVLVSFDLLWFDLVWESTVWYVTRKEKRIKEKWLELGRGEVKGYVKESYRTTRRNKTWNKWRTDQHKHVKAGNFLMRVGGVRLITVKVQLFLWFLSCYYYESCLWVLSVGFSFCTLIVIRFLCRVAGWECMSQKLCYIVLLNIILFWILILFLFVLFFSPFFFHNFSFSVLLTRLFILPISFFLFSTLFLHVASLLRNQQRVKRKIVWELKIVLGVVQFFQFPPRNVPTVIISSPVKVC